MKKYILMMTAAVALAGCSGEGQSSEVDTENAETGEVQSAEGQDNHVVTEEGPASSPFESDWYDKLTADETVVFEKMMDFNQDGIDELVLGTGAHLAVGVFDEAEEQWRSAYEVEAEAADFRGVMENETVGQLAAVTTVYEGDLETENHSLRLLRYTERGDGFEVIEAFRNEGIDSGDGGVDYQVAEEELAIMFEDELVQDLEYTLEGDQLIGEDHKVNLYSGLPITDDPEFTALFPTYFESGVLLGDSYNTAVEKAGQGEEGHLLGSPILQYDGFVLFHRDDTKLINQIMLRGNEEVSVEDLERVTGEEIEITLSENQMLGDLYTAEFTFDGVEYYAEFKDMDGMLNFLIVRQ